MYTDQLHKEVLFLYKNLHEPFGRWQTRLSFDIFLWKQYSFGWKGSCKHQALTSLSFSRKALTYYLFMGRCIGSGVWDYTASLSSSNNINIWRTLGLIFFTNSLSISGYIVYQWPLKNLNLIFKNIKINFMLFQ